MHYFFGVTWIGLLYYFNFVQGPFFAETDAPTKSQAFQKLVPRALWWFRYAALFTFLTGFTILSIRSHQMGAAFFASAWGIGITTGTVLGITMFANVWLVIWPNQKIVIANAVATASGGAANPAAAAAGAKALLASRSNVLMSLPMLFFMGAGRHLPIFMREGSKAPYWVAFFALWALIEGNALKGKLGPLTTVKGVIHMSLALTVVLYGLVVVLV
jgi:uncharacterized membrane protein